MLRSAPLARAIAPDTALWNRALVARGSLLIALTAQVAVPLPSSS